MYINPKTIYYIESEGKYSKIHVFKENISDIKIENGYKKIETIEYALEAITVLKALGSLKKLLPLHFCRINRFNIINMKKVVSTSKNTILFKGGFRKAIKGKITF